MKKVISSTLVFLLVIAMALPCLASDNETKKLTFNEDGKFRILMMSDIQDTDETNEDSLEFIRLAIEKTDPDLVVITGDQLSDLFLSPSYCNVKETLYNIFSTINDTETPFLFTFGNHDHCLDEYMSMAKQAEYIRSFEYCYAADDGCDPGTYNKLVYSKDGTEALFNIYMMDTNNLNFLGSVWDGVHKNQVTWYESKSAELKELNGGKVMPSILFQHIPVKEIYNLLEETSAFTEGAVSNPFAGEFMKYYVVDETKVDPGFTTMKECPGSEYILRTTGQYQAWQKTGDIVYGAFFGHDHSDNFLGTDENGITMGYCGCSGFATTGNGIDREMKIFDFDENDLSKVNISRVTYRELKTDYEPHYTAFYERIENAFISFLKTLDSFFKLFAKLFKI